MSYYDYLKSKELLTSGPTFAFLIMAAAKIAKTISCNKLRNAFPRIVGEFRRRKTTALGLQNGDEINIKINGEKFKKVFREKSDIDFKLIGISGQRGLNRVDIENKLIDLYMNDPIAHNVISRYVTKYKNNYVVGKNYPYQSNPILKVIHEHKEEIVFDLMLVYRKMLDDKDKFIRKIFEESQTPIIIDKKNFIKLSKKEGG